MTHSKEDANEYMRMKMRTRAATSECYFANSLFHNFDILFWE